MIVLFIRNIFLYNLVILFLIFSQNVLATIDIPFWHAMEGNLGEEINSLSSRFNKIYPKYRIIPIYKGTYPEEMAAGIAAWRTGNAPAILQVYEIGTVTMINSHAIKPVYQLFNEMGIKNNESDYIPAILEYYSDYKNKHLMSQPFNISIPVIYYNKDIFKKVGLNYHRSPKTWQELSMDAIRLHQSGINCSYAHGGYQGWMHIENFSSLHKLPMIIKNNNFIDTNSKLIFNGPVQINHIVLLNNMIKNHTSKYFGRDNTHITKFYSGECAMTMGSSGMFAVIKHYAKFNYGVGMMPYDSDVPGAPYNAIIGGGSLWVMAGKSIDVYRGVALFLQFLTKPKIVAEWHQKTGYMPSTIEGYRISKCQGYYNQNPGAYVAIHQIMNNKPSMSFINSIRLENLAQIFTVIDEELERVWLGQISPREGLNNAVLRGNLLLHRFDQKYFISNK